MTVVVVVVTIIIEIFPVIVGTTRMIAVQIVIDEIAAKIAETAAMAVEIAAKIAEIAAIIVEIAAIIAETAITIETMLEIKEIVDFVFVFTWGRKGSRVLCSG